MKEGNRESASSRGVMSVSWMEEEGERRSRGKGERELVQMNNLYRIPGIVCQGDDGRPVSKPKQTDYENTHTHSLSRELDEVIGGCETCFILIAGLEGLVGQCYTISVMVCVFGLNQLMMVLCVDVVKLKKRCRVCISVHMNCIIQNEIYKKYCLHDDLKSDAIWWKTAHFHMLPCRKACHFSFVCMSSK